ncbi:hypothetical protein SLS60_004753 [Paraconiothyrium brasiliense]|uniref:F-box domain-containing protein n=1 Tax=Paraconiothyrium brasiliense TaxID=300254 RepID=A0ABR3RL94_9PLEO
MWFSLPVELQRQCLQSLDVKTLRCFRLVNKSVSTLATEILFGTVRLYHPEQGIDLLDDESDEDTEKGIPESVQKYNNILENDSLCPLVRTVIFYTFDPNNNDEDDYDQSESDLDESYEKSLKSVSRFPNLREVRMVFSRICAVDNEMSAWTKDVAETVSFRTDVLNALLKGLCVNQKHSMPHFDSLTIKNLQDHISDSVYDSLVFAPVLRKLRRLNLCIATESDDAAPEHDINKPGCHKMFNNDLCTRWLAPLQGQLTHLSLYATQCLWGFWPFCDLRPLHFPHLQSLSLGNWTIAHEWQIDWILSHGATVEELLLDDCPIITAAYLGEEHVNTHFPGLEPLHVSERGWKIFIKELDLRWHHVFPRFSTGLPKLRHFAIGQGEWYEQKMFEERHELAPRLIHDRYYIFDNGIGPSQWVGGGGHWVLSNARNADENGRRGHALNTGEGQRTTYYFPACDEEDREALAELLGVVEGRSDAKV